MYLFACVPVFALLPGESAAIVQYMRCGLCKIMFRLQQNQERVSLDCSGNLDERTYDCILNELSLYQVYSEWYLKNQSKVSIKDMLVQMKRLNPFLELVALQEFPVEQELMAKLIQDLSDIGKVYTNSSPFVINNKQSGEDCTQDQYLS
jgi:hypothetical protein